MRITVPDHAKFRIMERGIDVDDAKRIVNKPESQKIQADGAILVKGTAVSGKKLTIIFEQKNKNHIVIITGNYEN